jgi:phosphoribosylaminoimidazole-succinocarboxamide synthase
MPEAAAALGKLLYRGSVKDVYGIEGRDPYVFEFSDRYSIFDWGEMPDVLPGKGEALAVMGDLCFRYLQEASTWSSWRLNEQYPKFWRDSLTCARAWTELRRSGLKHHSHGLVDAAGLAIPLGGRAKRLAVQALKRPAALSSTVDGKLSWNYSAYESRPDDVLVPLEVVFRFGAPEGSSFLQRLREIPNYAQSFGFAEAPRAGDWFPYPVVEFFTKLEPSDRFLSREEAKKVACLSEAELDHLTALTLLIALRLKDIFASIGLELWDGKFEFAFQPSEEKNRGFLLVDSIGPDELRLIGPGGVHFSKEFLRRVYRGGEWFQALEKAKKIAKERGEKDWKKICAEELKQFPAKLPPEAFSCAQSLYPSLGEALAKEFFAKKIFEEAQPILELCRRLKELA